MTQVYRFLPWARRGLAAAVPLASPPPLRAQAAFKISITPEIVAERSVYLLGPGDVGGIDLRLIVRTDPRPNAIDVEPNYLASIEFDAPDFPWMFTPSAAGEHQRLDPWLVLVVLDADRVAAPQVRAGRALPSFHLDAATARDELPPLSESWAWSHVQRVAAQGDRQDAEGLAAQPERNVSRLVCPRHLLPSKRYLACVVPAWDAGRDSGLARQRRLADAPLAPAWPDVIEADVELPVYYHWEFQTGLQGDFETLARRLEPHPVKTSGLDAQALRRGRMYLGGADGAADTQVDLPPEEASSSMRFEAPLEALDRPLSMAADTPRAFVRAVDRATKPAEPDAPIEQLTPPVYGDRLAGRDDLVPARLATHWLDELNLDPRTRVAARLGGDTVRSFQEDLMHLAWEQVGEVLAANDQLERSRFLAIAAERALVRHTAKLPPERLLMLTSLVHRRVRVDEFTVSGRIARTSLPDRAFDPVLRRLSSPVGRLARIAARAGPAGVRTHTSPALSRGLVEAFQRSEVAVDPSLGLRDGILDFKLGRLAAERGWNVVTVAGDVAQRFELPAAITQDDTRLSFAPRADLVQVGAFTAEHLQAAQLLATAASLPVATVIERTAAAMRANPGAVRLAVEVPVDRPRDLSVHAVVREAGHRFALVERGGARRPLLHLETPEAGDAALSAVLLHLPRGRAGEWSAAYRLKAGKPQVMFTEPVAALPPTRNANVRPDVVIGPGIAQPGRPATRGTRVRRTWKTVTGGTVVAPAAERRFAGVLPALVVDRAVTAALYTEIERHAAALPPVPKAAFVKADLGMAALVRQGIDPVSRFTRRAAMLIGIPEWIDRHGVHALDPIAATPQLAVPFADLLAQAAPERFLPPETTLPDNRIAALGTNPRFIAAFMVGANHEMNRELLWRSYPTDSRGTPATRFWNWSDAARRDVQDIHRWPQNGPLVERLSGGLGSQLVIVVRGRLLQRYPNTHVLLWKARDAQTLEPLGANPAAVLKEPAFRLTVEPDLKVAGFELPREQFNQGSGWFVVLQEPVSEARFGLDDEDLPPLLGGRPRVPRNANDLSWQAARVPGGRHLGVAGILGEASNAAMVAEKLLQRPVRFAIHSSELADITKAE